MEIRNGTTTPEVASVEWDAVGGASRYRVTYETDVTNAAVPTGSDWCLVEALGAGQTDAGILYGPPTVSAPETIPASATTEFTANIVTSGFTTPAATGVALPTYEAHVMPNHYPSTSTAADNLRNVTLYHDSPSTSTINTYTRIIATPDAQRSETIGRRSWEWWIALEMKVDSSWDSTKQGAFGSTNPGCHNLPYDVGNTGSGGVGWGFGEGTSAVQLDYISDDLNLHIQPQPPTFTPPNTVTAVANMTKGVWHSILLQVILGRADGTISASGHPNGGNGRIKAWIDGSDTPISSGDCSTLQRAINPANGTAYTQTLMGVWDVLFYTRQDSESFIELIMSATAVRIGRTLAECLADRPTLVGDLVANIYDGSGLNLGPSYYNTLVGGNARTTSDFQVPPSLQ